MTGWVAVSCRVADLIRDHRLVKPYGGRSDLGGQWGDPEVYTEWGLDCDVEEVVLREWRYPSHFAGEPDRKPCRHEVPTTDRKAQS